MLFRSGSRKGRNGMTRRGRNVLRICCLSAGIVLTAAGIWRGEASEVLDKAVRICLECIGIG